jgi:translocator protein
MKKDTLRQIAVVLAVVVTIVVNALADILPINGLGTGQISDQFKVFFVPAGYVFSIWGVIYLGLIAYAVFQALPSQKENHRLQNTAGLFIVSSIANCAWIFLWHYQLFLLTLLAMITLLVCLIMIYVRLGIGTGEKVSEGETWAVSVVFSVYLGWVTVATIANVTDVLAYLNWGGWGIAPLVWAVIMLAVALVVAALIAITRKDTAYLLVLVWAFYGIATKFKAESLLYFAALAASVIAGLLAVYTLLPTKKAN